MCFFVVEGSEVKVPLKGNYKNIKAFPRLISDEFGVCSLKYINKMDWLENGLTVQVILKSHLCKYRVLENGIFDTSSGGRIVENVRNRDFHRDHDLFFERMGGRGVNEQYPFFLISIYSFISETS